MNVKQSSASGLTWVLGLGLFLSAAVAGQAQIRVVVRPPLPRPVVIGHPPPPPVRRPPVVVARVPPPPPVVVTEPAEPPVGRIRLQVEPSGAQVFVDGVYAGRARDFDGYPDFLLRPFGEHRVTLALEGFKTVHFVVQANPARVVTLDVALVPVQPNAPPPEAVAYDLQVEQSGALRFAVKPSDATVYVDDAYYGVVSDFSAEGAGLMLQAGAHKVELVRPGFKTYLIRTQIKPGETRMITLAMKKRSK